MYVGVDLGGTTVKAGIVDNYGSIIHQGNRNTRVSQGYMAIIDDIEDLIQYLTLQARISINELTSIGIGIPGLADYKTGNVIYCTNLSWNNVPLADELRRRFNKPVYVENDATVAALAESLFGSTKGVPNSVFMTLGTGVGGGIIINGQIYSGSHGAGSEIGHMIVGENFYNCNCGNNGCLETFASATALIKYVVHQIKSSNRQSVLRQYCNESTDTLTAKVIFDAAKGKDELALEAVNRMIKYLAIGAVNVFNLLDPDVIAIGGGVSMAGQYLINLLNEQVKKTLFSTNISYGNIVLASLGNEAGIVGAAFLGNNNYN